MTKAILGSFLLAFLVVIGCADSGPTRAQVYYKVYVSSFGNSIFHPNSTFVIVQAVGGPSQDDPEFQEYAAYLEGILVRKGFKRASAPDTADFEVSLNYGISNASTSMTGSESGGMGYVWSNGLSTYNGRTSYAYDTTYQRTCQVVAYDLASYRVTGKMKQVWRTQMVSVGHFPDLRRVFPYLLAAGYGYLGMDSGEQQTIVMDQDDPTVEVVRGSLTPPPP
jgi:hypothetical protein